MEDKDSYSGNLDQILDLLYGAGYVDATNSDAPPSQKIAAALSWCIAAITDDGDDDDDARGMEESLRLAGCPHPLRVQDLDTQAIFPVIQCLTSHLQQIRTHRATEVFDLLLIVTEAERLRHWPVSSKSNGSFYHVCHAENTIETDECRTSIEALSCNLDELVGEMDKMLDMKLAPFCFVITCLHAPSSPFVIFDS
ncbi:hypothetical protein VNO78_00966 [Psophocarpus tetragonolobus]|uniref:CCDC93 N-terminal domain-containing protein n=1 Tax=Psophocarpus tetragonolobus TaxID=3891 RepID=A0AAN9T8L0_PSOTE